MKRAIILMAVLGLVATFVYASTNEVTSVNATGFVKVTLEAGKYKLMTVNFDMIDGNYSITNMLSATELPSGTLVYLWSEALQQYAATESVASFPPPIHWNPGTNVLDRGMCIWIKAPSACTLTIKGEVPADGSSPVTLAPGFTFAGYPFPTDCSITNTSLGTFAQSGDLAYFWKNGWVSESWQTFPPPAKWNPGTNMIAIGEGFLYKSGVSTNKVWSQSKPYLWP